VYQSNTDLLQVHDRTIPTRREQLERQEERVSDEVIRLALQTSATEASREEA